MAVGTRNLINPFRPGPLFSRDELDCKWETVALPSSAGQNCEKDPVEHVQIPAGLWSAGLCRLCQLGAGKRPGAEGGLGTAHCTWPANPRVLPAGRLCRLP